MVDPDYTATVSLTRDQARALVAAADADGGSQALRTAAVIRLLLHNALRVDEACAADVADLGADAGHRVLRVTRKGARKAKVPLAPATAAALDAYLNDRARRAALGSPAQLAGPLLATAIGGRLRQGHLWELVRRLARTAGIETWQELSPHSLRHSAITFASTPGRPCATCRTTPGTRTPGPPGAMTTPGTAWTATRPTRCGVPRVSSCPGTGLIQNRDRRGVPVGLRRLMRQAVVAALRRVSVRSSAWTTRLRLTVAEEEPLAFAAPPPVSVRMRSINPGVIHYRGCQGGT